MSIMTEIAQEVDIESLSQEEANQLGQELGLVIGQVGDKAALELNEMLAKYGLKAKIAVQILDKKTDKPFS